MLPLPVDPNVTTSKCSMFLAGMYYELHVQPEQCASKQRESNSSDQFVSIFRHIASTHSPSTAGLHLHY